MRDWMNDRFGRGRTITREAVVQTPLRLELHTSHGRVSVRGIEGTSAIVRAEIDFKGFHRDDGGQAEEMVVAGIVFEGDRLRIESPAEGRDSLNVHYEVSVPFATLANLTVLNGPIELIGIEGPVDVTLTNGPLVIEGIHSAVELELTNGPAHVQRCRGPVDAKVANGPIHIEDVAGPLDVTVNNGPISIEDVSAGIKASAINGPVTYRGAVGGNFDMRSTHGGIVLELPGDSRFELDAEAERGDVYCDFDVKDQTGAPSGGQVPRIVLRSERGEIVVQQTTRAGASR